MFGIFKKKVTPEEFGEGVVQLASEWISADAARSLGMRFENFDASQGWKKFLEHVGVPVETQLLYIRFVRHCAMWPAAGSVDTRLS